MYSIVSVVNNIVMHSWKLPRVSPKSSQHKEKKSFVILYSNG